MKLPITVSHSSPATNAVVLIAVGTTILVEGGVFAR